MIRLLTLVIFTLTFHQVFVEQVAVGQKLGFPLSPFQKKVEADSNKDYRLGQQQGPWLILVTTFAGENANQHAKELVMDLRKNFRLKAYSYSTVVDLSKPIDGLYWKQSRNKETGQLERQKMRNLNGGKFNEISVLVGDFHSVEDPGALKVLERVKSIRPSSYSRQGTRPTNQFIGAMRELVNMNDNAKKNRGPFRAAFMIPNPTLPEEYFSGDGVDHFIINLNKNVKNSLLDCPKEYSVRVATFRGDVSFNLKEIEKKKNEINLKRLMGGGVKSKLAEAADKASQLCNALRKRGIEAYEFHDRHESYVCVGSFDWVGKPRRDGKQEINPYVLKVIEMYKAHDAAIPGLQGLLQPRSLPELPKITFDMQPVAVKVPKLSTLNQIIRDQNQ